MKTKYLVKTGSLILFTLYFFFTAFSQKSEVKGRITIWNDIPLENIAVTSKKSKQETKTDGLGFFSIEISQKDKLKFSAAGFADKRINVKPGDKNLHIKMRLLSNEYAEEEEIANDGFRYIPKQYRATAITKLETELANELSAYNSVWDMIVGRCAGVVVIDNLVYMREGISGSLSGESQPAIIVINGMQVPASSLDDLDPQNVKSVSLLKGGAAAIYGGSGGNGVVVIKTK